jgi:DNA adenine methylase
MICIECKKSAEELIGDLCDDCPAPHLIAKFDGPGTLHYIDPPYMPETRSQKRRNYRFEMTDEDHAELASALQSVKGMVVLSGYDCPLYANLQTCMRSGFDSSGQQWQTGHVREQKYSG